MATIIASPADEPMFTPQEAGWPPLRQGYWALAVLIFAYAIAFLDRIILAMVMGPIQGDLLLTDVQLALLHGFAFVIFYVVAGFPLGKLADTHSRRKLILVGVLVWSVSTAACGFAVGFWSLFLLRIGVGIGEAALSPAAFSLIADYFPARMRARAISIYQLGVTGGSTLAYLLGGFVVAFAMGNGPVDLPVLGATEPWRISFLLVGVPGLLAAILVWTIVEPKRRETKPGQSSGASGETLPIGPWLRANRNTVLCFTLGYGCINMAFNTIIAWGPTWLGRVHDFSPASVGISLGLLMLFAGGGGQVLMALKSDRALTAGRPTAVFDTGILCALLVVPAALLGVAPNVGVALALLGVLVFAVCGAIGHAPSVIGQIAPNQLRGRLSAIYLFVLNMVGSGIGPLMVAMLTDHVFHDPRAVGVSIAITAGFGGAAGALILYLGRSALVRSAALSTANSPIEGHA